MRQKLVHVPGLNAVLVGERTGVPDEGVSIAGVCYNRNHA